MDMVRTKKVICVTINRILGIDVLFLSVTFSGFIT